jgi:hypothetical protein
VQIDFGDRAGSGQAHRDMLKFKYHGDADCVYRRTSTKSEGGMIYD